MKRMMTLVDIALVDNDWCRQQSSAVKTLKGRKRKHLTAQRRFIIIFTVNFIVNDIKTTSLGDVFMVAIFE